MNNLKLTIIMLFILIASCKKEETKPATPEPLPIADFIYKVIDNSGLVTFTNKSINATSYTWDFGNGKTSNDLNPIHRFANLGTYEVTLTAINSAGSHTYSVNAKVNMPSHLSELMVYTKSAAALASHINVYINGNYAGQFKTYYIGNDIPQCGTTGITINLPHSIYYDIECRSSTGTTWNINRYINPSECNTINLTK